MGNKEIDDYVEAISTAMWDMDQNIKNFWPLNGGQVASYFDVAEGLDIYNRLNELKKTKSIKEIAELFPPPDMIKSFLQFNGSIGPKVARVFELDKITVEETVEYLSFLFEIIKIKMQSNYMNLDGKNLLLDKTQIDKLVSETNWVIPKSSEKKSLANLIVTANHLCYSLFFDLYQTAGFYIHGPYDVSEKFGDGAILVVRECHNINPKDIWPELKMPYHNLVVQGIYKNLDFKLDFSNHPTTNTGIADKLIAYRVILDGKEIKIKKMEEIELLFEKITEEQTKKIEGLSDFDKIRKGAQISFSLFKKLRDAMGDDDSKLLTQVEETIEKFGDKFIKQFAEEKIESKDHWAKLFDPRNDYL